MYTKSEKEMKQPATKCIKEGKYTNIMFKKKRGVNCRAVHVCINFIYIYDQIEPSMQFDMNSTVH